MMTCKKGKGSLWLDVLKIGNTEALKTKLVARYFFKQQQSIFSKGAIIFILFT